MIFTWPGPVLLTVEEPLKFMEWLNSIHPDLVFTYFKDGVEFLYTYVYAVGDVLHTKLYSKPLLSHPHLMS